MTVQTITINIDGKNTQCFEKETILDAALNAGIYIPTLCYHPDLPNFGACGLCVVEVKGNKEPVLACKTTVEQGLVITTSSPSLKEIRQEKLAEILSNHPHACLVCAERDGCAREPCSLNVPVAERCCEKLGDCELQRVAEYVGIKEDTPRYKPRNMQVYEKDPIMIRDYNLCIGCARCVRACSSLRGIDALGELPDPPELLDPSKFPEDLLKSGCQFCGLCIEVCPTGALMDRNDVLKDYTSCQDSCPAHIDIPRFLRQIAEGQFSEALATMYEAVPLPGTLGWVCNYPCEEQCQRNELDKSVSIRVLKRLAFEQSKDIKIKKMVDSNSSKKIAIIGAGPAGLSCGFYLSRLGHRVQIFEAKSKAGGMLRYGIPTFRLPRWVIEKEIEIIKKTGVDIKLNKPISSLDELSSQDFDAVFVAIGAQQGPKMRIEGEDDTRVVDALDFLSNVYGEIDTHSSVSSDKVKIGPRVAVIGGGNTAIDAARTAIRLGAKVTIFYRRSEAEMPAFPKEIEEAKREGVEFRFLSAPTAIHPGKDGLNVNFVKMKLGPKDTSGRPLPIQIENSKFSHEFDNIITAIGQKVIPLDDLETNDKGWIDCNKEKLKLKQGVYVGGDAIRPSSVVDAVSMGRKAALQIHRDLGGTENDILQLIQKPTPRICDSKVFLKDRLITPMVNIDKRLSNFAEIELSLDKNEGINEANRCFQCDLRLFISKVPEPPVEMLLFDKNNVDLVPEKAGVYILYNEGKTVIEIKGTSNLRQMLKEKLGRNDKIKFFKFEEDPMYSKRESELLQQYIQQHGEMPSGGDELDDLF